MTETLETKIEKLKQQLDYIMNELSFLDEAGPINVIYRYPGTDYFRIIKLMPYK